MVGLRNALEITLALAVASCNVPDSSPSTGGVDVPNGPCGRGVVVIESDYSSTNVALVGFNGATYSGSFLSSGSLSPGISMALSGDVVAPLERPSSSIVLLDRYPNAVLTWADPVTAGVTAQLSVAAGFASNPHDYLDVGDGKAYVSRYGSNPSPGKQPWDQGGDLLVLQSNPPSIRGRIDLRQPDDGDLLPRPDRMIRLGSSVAVLLQRFDATFSRAGDGRVVGIDPSADRIAWRIDLTGFASCGAVARSPSGATWIVVCSGTFQDGAAQLQRSGIAVFDATSEPPLEIRRYDAATRLGAPLAPAIGYASETLVVGVAYGNLDAPTGDRLFSLDLASGEVTTLLETSEPFVLGEVRCARECGEPCLVADAQSRGLRVWRATESGVMQQEAMVGLSDGVGLPPRSLGGF